LDLCLPTTKNSDAEKGAAVQGTGFFSPFSFSFSLLLFLSFSFSSPSLTSSARSALLAFPNI
jgi:hypothetical protein